MSKKDSAGTAELLKAARAMRKHAHAPYSGFRVGAAVRGKSGGIYTGCNVENAAYPLSLCAEAAAIAAMVAAGETEIAALAVAGPDDAPATMPCGGCRQRLAEFASRDTAVIVGDGDGPPILTTLDALLPHAFTAGSLKKS